MNKNKNRVATSASEVPPQFGHLPDLELRLQPRLHGCPFFLWTAILKSRPSQCHLRRDHAAKAPARPPQTITRIVFDQPVSMFGPLDRTDEVGTQAVQTVWVQYIKKGKTTRRADGSPKLRPESLKVIAWSETCGRFFEPHVNGRRRGHWWHRAGEDLRGILRAIIASPPAWLAHVPRHPVVERTLHVEGCKLGAASCDAPTGPFKRVPGIKGPPPVPKPPPQPRRRRHSARAPVRSTLFANAVLDWVQKPVGSDMVTWCVVQVSYGALCWLADDGTVHEGNAFMFRFSPRQLAEGEPVRMQVSYLDTYSEVAHDVETQIFEVDGLPFHRALPIVILEQCLRVLDRKVRREDYETVQEWFAALKPFQAIPSERSPAAKAGRTAAPAT